MDATSGLDVFVHQGQMLLVQVVQTIQQSLKRMHRRSGALYLRRDPIGSHCGYASMSDGLRRFSVVD